MKIISMVKLCTGEITWMLRYGYLRDILSFKKNIGGSLISRFIQNGGRFSKWLLRDKNNYDF